MLIINDYIIYITEVLTLLKLECQKHYIYIIYELFVIGFRYINNLIFDALKLLTLPTSGLVETLYVYRFVMLITLNNF
jgi:hypothetical protein